MALDTGRFSLTNVKAQITEIMIPQQSKAKSKKMSTRMRIMRSPVNTVLKLNSTFFLERNFPAFTVCHNVFPVLAMFLL